MIISGRTLLFGQWLSAFDFIYQGADRIARTYAQAAKAPFAIPALSNYQVLVSSHEDVQKLANAPEEVLSFRKALFDRLFFTYTMGGFTPNHIDPHNSIPVRVFKVLVRENLPKLSMPIKDRVAEVFDEHFKAGRVDQPDGTSKIRLHMLSGTLIARMNNELLFGTDMAQDREFEKDTIKYGWDSALAMEIFRQVPTSFVPIVARLYMAWSGSMHRVTRRVQILVNSRLWEQRYEPKKDQGKERKHQDGTDWVISCSHTPEQAKSLRIAQQMMALLFASTHQMQMTVTWAIVDLCLNPEYITLLRAEIEDVFKTDGGGDPYNRLRLMECFLRESSRLNPLDSRKLSPIA
jgi:cytochrome P450